MDSSEGVGAAEVALRAVASTKKRMAKRVIIVVAKGGKTVRVQRALYSGGREKGRRERGWTRRGIKVTGFLYAGVRLTLRRAEQTYGRGRRIMLFVRTLKTRPVETPGKDNQAGQPWNKSFQGGEE